MRCLSEYACPPGLGIGESLWRILSEWARTRYLEAGRNLDWRRSLCWPDNSSLYLRASKDPPESPLDSILMLEHPHVYTLGRGADEANVLFAADDPECPHEIFRVERGGEVTYHGPGQLVAYPILDLACDPAHAAYRQDLHWYLRQVEEVVIRVLAEYGLDAQRDPEYTGVWVGPKKARGGVHWFSMWAPA